MRLKHFEYIRLVTETFKKRQENKELSFLLTRSTRAKIRKACLHVYKDRYRKEDERMLRDFFGPAEQGKQFLLLIQNFDVDKFRPLDNYLKGSTEKTDDINIELLAWLIDFKHRPYSSDNNVILSEEELSIINQTTELCREYQNDDLVKKENETAQLLLKKPAEAPLQNDCSIEISLNSLPKNTDEKVPFAEVEQGEEAKKNNTEPIAFNTGLPKNKATRNFKSVLVIFLIVSISCVGLYGLLPSNSRCVYWAGDHYERVDCDEEPNGRLIIPMKEKKRKPFSRITQQDTITERSIGKIYYIKDSNKIEYYTEGGNYPEDVTRSLKKLSAYIYKKYLQKQEFSNKDSLPKGAYNKH